jgi:tubulin beta
MSGLTTFFRFRDMPIGTLSQFANSMVPIEKFRFLVPSFAPVTARRSQQCPPLTVPELVAQIFNAGNMMAACDLEKYTYISSAAIFRGPISANEAEEELNKLWQRKNF